MLWKILLSFCLFVTAAYATSDFYCKSSNKELPYCKSEWCFFDPDSTNYGCQTGSEHDQSNYTCVNDKIEGCILISPSTKQIYCCCLSGKQNFCNNRWIKNDEPKYHSVFDIIMDLCISIILLLVFIVFVAFVVNDVSERKQFKRMYSFWHFSVRAPLLLFVVIIFETVTCIVIEVLFWAPFSYTCHVTDGPETAGKGDLAYKSISFIRTQLWFFLYSPEIKVFYVAKHIFWPMPIFNIIKNIYVSYFVLEIYLRPNNKSKHVLTVCVVINIISGVFWVLSSGLNLFVLTYWFNFMQPYCEPGIGTEYIAVIMAILIVPLFSFAQILLLYWLSRAKQNHLRLNRNRRKSNSNSIEQNLLKEAKSAISNDEQSIIEMSPNLSKTPDSSSLKTALSTSLQSVRKFVDVDKSRVELFREKVPIQKTQLTIRNLESTTVAFRLLVNQPFVYAIRPNCGFLEAGESQTINISFCTVPKFRRFALNEPADANVNRNHQIMLNAMIVQRNSTTDRHQIWLHSTVSRSKWQRTLIPVYFDTVKDAYEQTDMVTVMKSSDTQSTSTCNQQEIGTNSKSKDTSSCEIPKITKSLSQSQSQ